MLDINFSRQVEKFFRKVPPKHARQIGGKMMALRENPQPHNSIVPKGAASLYRRTDIGEYRVVYRVDGGILEIILVGKRNDDDVYKMIRRIL
jgi:mRNA interferase RelE/StbE